MVRFGSLTSAIGVDLHHFEHFRTDHDAVNLGLHDDASLILKILSTRKVESYELDENFDKILEEAKAVVNRLSAHLLEILLVPPDFHFLHRRCALSRACLYPSNS